MRERKREGEEKEMDCGGACGGIGLSLGKIHFQENLHMF